MNEKIMRAAGFNEEVNKVKEGKCPFCGKTIKQEDFRDELSRKEFGISGLCQNCQDAMFGGADTTNEDVDEREEELREAMEDAYDALMDVIIDYDEDVYSDDNVILHVLKAMRASKDAKKAYFDYTEAKYAESCEHGIVPSSLSFQVYGGKSYELPNNGAPKDSD